MIIVTIISLFVHTLVIFLTINPNDDHVTLVSAPHHGIQPQAVLDTHGNLHLLLFQGDPKGGNLLYMRRDKGKSDFSQPLRVNSQEKSAIALGTIRGGQLAMGKNGRVHVAWNGSSYALPKNPIVGMPMLYARLNDAGTAFEEQRNLMTRSAILDGGGTLADDGDGNVYIAWHGLDEHLVKGEDNRKVWVAISKDEGKTFTPEKPAWNEPTGACGCCGMRGFADGRGNVYFTYRAARHKKQRGMHLLKTNDKGKSFQGVRLDNWEIESCPMSSEAIAAGPKGIYVAWDKEEQIYLARLHPETLKLDSLQALTGRGANRKHPALAVNGKGELMVAWTEGTGWNQGGDLAWHVYDKSGRPTAECGRLSGAIPAWSFPAALAEADGRFTLLH